MVGPVAKKQESSSMVKTPSISGAMVEVLRPYLKPFTLTQVLSYEARVQASGT